MLFLVLFTFVTSSAINGTKSYDECLKDGWKLPSACSNAKNMHDLGKKGCELQGKKFDGHGC